MSTSRVCTILIDLEPKDIEDPLAQFNHTFPSRASILGLVKTLNSALGANGLDIRILDQVFDTYWPQFETRFSSILEQTKSNEPTKPRPKEDMLGEILENTRIMSSRIRKLETELDRGRKRDFLDMSPSMLREQINDMVVNEGLPPDSVIEHFAGRVPSRILKEVLMEALERSNGKEKV